MVTCASFQHIWLNEGFAEYGESLWYEAQYGVDRMHIDMNSKKYFGSGTIFVEDTTSVRSIFHSGLSYAKASWVLHMLRHVVGDSAFFKGLQEYGDRYRFKSAVTEQFRDVMEEISGKDLDAFFQRWIYGEYYPIYEVVYIQSDNNLLVQINQIQDSDIFKMPIDIKANFTDNSEQLWVVQNTQKSELFTLVLPTSSVIESIELDPDNWILKKISEIRRDTLGNGIIPDDFYLYPVYPNPFNAGVTIRFELEDEGEVQLNVFDISGKRIWQHSAKFTIGTHSIKWDGKNLHGYKVPSGTYFIEASNGPLIKTKKMLLLR
jgi:hypothetical protein